MDFPKFLIPVAGIVFAGIALWILAASLPESFAWLIRRWIGLWSFVCGRSNRQQVRERIHEIEGCFWDCYDSERRDGSDATRAAFRALWLVGWEVLMTPKAAAAAAASVSAEHSRRRSDMPILPGPIRIVFHVAKKKITVGPIASLMIVTPGFSYGTLALLGIASMDALGAALIGLNALQAMLAFRRRGSFTSKMSRAYPLLSALFVLCYLIMWSGIIVANTMDMPAYTMDNMIRAAVAATGTMYALIFRISWSLIRIERARILLGWFLAKDSDGSDRDELLSLKEQLDKYP